MESLDQFFKDNQRGYLRDPRRMAYAKLQKNTQGMDREQLEAFINANLFIPHSQYKMALGNLIQFLKKQDQVNKLNEVRQFQKLAGLLKENEADQIVDKVEDSLEDKLDQLSPEQIQKLQADLVKLGITADTAIEDAAEKIEGSLDEIEGDDKKKLANALQSIGTGLIGSLLVPIIPVAIGQGTGLGTATGLGITLAAGGLLVGLAKALKAKSDSKVNEDDYSEDPSSDMDDESQSGDTDAMSIDEDQPKKKGTLDQKEKIVEKLQYTIEDYLEDLGLRKIPDEETPKFEKGFGFTRTTPSDVFNDKVSVGFHFMTPDDDPKRNDPRHNDQEVHYNLRIYKPNERFNIGTLRSFIQQAKREAQKEGFWFYDKVNRSNRDITFRLTVR